MVAKYANCSRQKKHIETCVFSMFFLCFCGALSPQERMRCRCTGWGGSKFGDRGFFRKRGGVNLGWILYSYGPWLLVTTAWLYISMG